jgi:hypothetical protein
LAHCAAQHNGSAVQKKAAGQGSARDREEEVKRKSGMEDGISLLHPSFPCLPAFPPSFLPASFPSIKVAKAFKYVTKHKKNKRKTAHSPHQGVSFCHCWVSFCQKLVAPAAAAAVCVCAAVGSQQQQALV